MPSTLAESDCYLQRAVGPRLEAALRRGVLNALPNLSGDGTSEDVAVLFGAIDVSLEAEYPDAGTARGTLLLHILGYLDDYYRFSRWDAARQPRLQRLIAARGISWADEQLGFLFLSYLRSLGYPELDPVRFERAWDSAEN